jgi:hypothetical protein
MPLESWRRAQAYDLVAADDPIQHLLPMHSRVLLRRLVALATSLLSRHEQNIVQSLKVHGYLRIGSYH